MSTVIPSVKGTIFGVAVDDVIALVERRRVARAELSRWLRPEDLALLVERPLASGWYDVGAYARMSALLRDVVGGGSDEFLRQLGRRTARQLIASGHYGQLEYARRTERQGAATSEERFEAFGRDLRIFTSLSGSILNFSRWSARAAPEQRRWVLEVSDAAALPPEVCWRSDGFVNEIAAQHGDPDLWVWKRERPDLVVFRMVREI